MPTPLSPTAHRLMTDPYGGIFSGAPSWIQTLSRFLLPNPQAPYAFAALRALDPQAELLVKLAKKYISEFEGNKYQLTRMWDYLERHPEEIKVRTQYTTPGLEEASGYYSMPTKTVTMNLQHGYNPGTTAHELTHAAQDLAGVAHQNPPGMQINQALIDLYNSHRSSLAGEALPQLIHPSLRTPTGQPIPTSRVSDMDKFLETIQRWWPTLP